MAGEDTTVDDVRNLYDEIATLRETLETLTTERDEARSQRDLIDAALVREHEFEKRHLAELEAIRTELRHVVDCYRHRDLMAVIVGVDKLAGMVDP